MIGSDEFYSTYSGDRNSHSGCKVLSAGQLTEQGFIHKHPIRCLRPCCDPSTKCTHPVTPVEAGYTAHCSMWEAPNLQIHPASVHLNLTELGSLAEQTYGADGGQRCPLNIMRATEAALMEGTVWWPIV